MAGLVRSAQSKPLRRGRGSAIPFLSPFIVLIEIGSNFAALCNRIKIPLTAFAVFTFAGT
jgi:hypothetical protein